MAEAERDEPGVTLVVSRVVRPGREAEFESWARDIQAAAQGFPGPLGTVRLKEPSGVSHFVTRFDEPAHLKEWETSAERRSLVEKADRISEERRQTAIGLDAWFAISPQATSPRWKTWVVTWCAVYPALLVVSLTIRALVPDLWLPAQLAISSLVLTGALTWLVMPTITRLLRPWLLRGTRPIAE